MGIDMGTDFSAAGPVLAGYDGSEGGCDALTLGALIAERIGAELVVGAVLPNHTARRFAEASVGSVEHDVERALEERARRAAADMPGARAETVHASSPARGLYDLATALGASVVAIGSSNGTAGRTRAGRTAHALLQGSPAAVALAPVGFRYESPGLRVIGVAVDGSPESDEALAAAVAVADGATLRLMSVAGSPVAGYWGYGSWGYGLEEMGEAAVDLARGNLDRAVAEVPPRLRPATKVLHGDVAAELVREAEQGIDLLCLGSRGFGPVRRVLLGSVSSAVVRDVECPVLVVPRSSTDHDPAAEPIDAAEVRAG